MGAVAEKKRIEYFDYLRIIAVFLVITIHVCTPYWSSTEVASPAWKVLNLYESLSRWAAPVFFMISGTLFLGNNQPFGRILRKNVLHLVTAFVFWSALYIGICYAKGQYTVFQAVGEFLNGYYHMWYLHAAVGLYLAVPVFRKIAQSKEATEHFLILSLLFGMVLPHIAACAGLWDPDIQQILHRQLENIDLSVATGYSFYFLLGHYLHNRDFTRRQRKGIYLLGLAGFVYTALLTSVLSGYKQQAVHSFYDYLTPNAACCCAAVFVFARENLRHGRLPKVAISMLQSLSKYSFGIYLSHPLLYDLLRYNLGVDPMSYPPVLSVPFFALVLFAASAVITFVLRRIPVLGKWVV